MTRVTAGAVILLPLLRAWTSVKEPTRTVQPQEGGAGGGAGGDGGSRGCINEKGRGETGGAGEMGALACPMAIHIHRPWRSCTTDANLNPG